MATVSTVANAGSSDAPVALFEMFGAVFAVAREGDCRAVLDTWSEELGICQGLRGREASLIRSCPSGRRSRSRGLS